MQTNFDIDFDLESQSQTLTLKINFSYKSTVTQHTWAANKYSRVTTNLWYIHLYISTLQFAEVSLRAVNDTMERIPFTDVFFLDPLR